MELGARLKLARLAAGLSQRQLCGDAITRNMLSQIENGTARPSMDTLQYLAGILGKPVGYFLEDEAVTSPNQQLMEQVRLAYDAENWTEITQLLQNYTTPDEIFDRERYLIGALARLELAAVALRDGKAAYAEVLLTRAGEEGKRTPYYTTELERRRICLLYAARPDQAKELCKLLPPDPQRTLLLAAANPERAELILEADPQDTPQWHQLRGDVYFVQKRYSKARDHYEKAPMSKQLLQNLEQCCREQEDYKAAYEYACRLREEYGI